MNQGYNEVKMILPASRKVLRGSVAVKGAAVQAHVECGYMLKVTRRAQCDAACLESQHSRGRG